MNARSVRAKLEQACRQLYLEEKLSIDMRVHEDQLTSRLAEILRPLFPQWTVSPFHNREGTDGTKKHDAEGAFTPDIIIHTLGVPTGPNLAAVEVKGAWNREDRAEDERNLRRAKAAYGYRFLFQIELQPRIARITLVRPFPNAVKQKTT